MDMRQNNRAVGETYERKAAAYLKSLGYEIIEYNFRCRQGEIDIVARDGEYLVFCEVKYRTNLQKGSPEEAISLQKMKRISKTALYYLHTHHLGDVACRFDVVSVLGDEIKLYKNAFEFMD